jgi:hypothetical protein
MALPSTKPLDGEFWYILDDQDNLDWRPRPNQRGDFYLGWLGQNRNVIGAGLARLKQGQVTHICIHGTPYYWLQPHQVLPIAAETLQAKQVLGADTMSLDFSLAGWELRDQSQPSTRPWPDTAVPANVLEPLLGQAVTVIVRNFRSDGEPPPPAESEGLLSRVPTAPPSDPLEALLDQLKGRLGEPNVVPVLIELVSHDINVMPDYRQSALFENLPTGEELPSPSKVARLVLSAIYHLGPIVKSRRLATTLLLNSLRQRHPFDVTWGADFLVKCIGMSNLVRLLQAAAAKETDDQVRGNVLDLLQELGYGFSVGLDGEVLNGLSDLLSQDSTGAFFQVVGSHLSFAREYGQLSDAAVRGNG